MASMYAVFHGPEGLKAIAQRIHRKTVRLAKGLESLGFAVEPREFFDTITVEVGSLQGVILKAAVAEGINLRKVGTSRIGIALDERARAASTRRPSGRARRRHARPCPRPRIPATREACCGPATT